MDNPKNLTIVSGFASMETAIAFRDNPDLRDAMGRAGVVGHPRIELYEEIESVQY